MKVIVGERGQVTIQKALRDRLGVEARTALEIREENGRLVAEKFIDADPISKVIGCLKMDGHTDEIIALMRGR